MGKTINRISTGFHLVTKDEIKVNAFDTTVKLPNLSLRKVKYENPEW